MAEEKSAWAKAVADSKKPPKKPSKAKKKAAS
jgi:hypothetical protein